MRASGSIADDGVAHGVHAAGFDRGEGLPGSAGSSRRSGWRRMSATPTEWSMPCSTSVQLLRHRQCLRPHVDLRSAGSSSRVRAATGGVDPRPSARRSARRRDDGDEVVRSGGPGVNDHGLSRRHIIQQVENAWPGWERTTSTCTTRTPRMPTRLWRRRCPRMTTWSAGEAAVRGAVNYPAWQVTQALWIADDRRLHAPAVSR